VNNVAAGEVLRFEANMQILSEISTSKYSENFKIACEIKQNH